MRSSEELEREGGHQLDNNCLVIKPIIEFDSNRILAVNFSRGTNYFNTL